MQLCVRCILHFVLLLLLHFPILLICVCVCEVLVEAKKIV